VAEHIEPGARVYAQAVYDAAVDADRVSEVNSDLQDFVAGLVENRPLAGALLNPRFPREAKLRTAASVLKDAEPLLRNGVLLMIENNRTALLPDMAVALGELAAVRERILDIEVTTAIPLEQSRLDQLQERISVATGLRARINATVEPGIIGGLVLRAGGVLLDASVTRRLEDLRLTLKQTPLLAQGASE
jgi:F-type H+-transporting ATPase subunit delta